MAEQNSWNNIKQLGNLLNNDSWRSFFDNNKEKLINIEKEICGTNDTIYPEPKLVFNALNKVSLKDIRVVIIGLDPYPKPGQAMGLSFSVSNNITIPSSLQNIFKNLQHFGHINNMPTSGDLTRWTDQGCLLLNCSLTVKENTVGSHVKYWEPFTDKLIDYISDNTTNSVFLLWGAQAFAKLKYINSDDNKVIISSHPSGLSCNKPMKQYGAFKDVDHFGLANKYLIEHGKKAIIW